MKNGITAACAIALLLGTAAAQAQSAAACRNWPRSIKPLTCAASASRSSSVLGSLAI